MLKRPAPRGRLKAAALAFALAFAGACETTRESVAVPGGRTDQFQGRYVILGLENRTSHVTVTEAVEASQRGFEVQLNPTETVPVGTRAIVPAITGWAIGYGEANVGDDPLRARAFNEPLIVWNRRDAFLGMAQIDITVRRIGRVNRPPGGVPSQDANLRITLRVSDHWQNKPWWAEVRYQLIFLGCANGLDVC